MRDHELFQREGRELICHVPITYSQAALGATIDVPTLDGCEQLEIAAGTQTGDVFRMSGRGMPEPGYRGRGALHVQVAIEVPKKLNDEHRRILRELAEVEEVDVSPRRETFFGKLKEYFQTD